jgi:DNA repair protein RecO (recombination protein O)
LSRTDFGEADRIITLLTPEFGKLRLLARGVRRVKSKLAGGIELFSVSTITFARGRSEIGTLVSTRLVRHYGKIVGNLERTMFGYELIKQLNKITEDEPEPEYFDLLQQAFEALDDAAIPLQLIRLWFSAQLLQLGGHAPNLQTDAAGNKLQLGHAYRFDFDSMAFALVQNETDRPEHFSPEHIKFLRLVFAGNVPRLLAKVQGSVELTAQTTPLVATMLRDHLRV